jgi:hypothetical protein
VAMHWLIGTIPELGSPTGPRAGRRALDAQPLPDDTYCRAGAGSENGGRRLVKRASCTCYRKSVARLQAGEVYLDQLQAVCWDVTATYFLTSFRACGYGLPGQCAPD